MHERESLCNTPAHWFFELLAKIVRAIIRVLNMYKQHKYRDHNVALDSGSAKYPSRMLNDPTTF